ncbi:dephospho-CoA kinase [Limnobacter humi]|uniref:Dephospho-CoA kinase n=1 Tax=Limnobacter humi TaxID=1778671 RepID=A0ABT1WHS5_9BURK|nr:dephospho-CoA kinase [Limnobacter humi]MCQ8897058.1 dephospho-CoA kinase [Limnobacter humi]
MQMKKPQQVLTIGLTGGIGSGKTTVSNRLAHLGAHVVDADEVAHKITGAGGIAMPAIEAAFGQAAVRPDGAMNRDYIRTLAFDEPATRQVLEQILHPLIRQTIEQALHRVTAPYCVLVIPLLFEKGGWREVMDAVVVVDCPVELQIARVKKRNGWPEAQIHAVIEAQATRATRLAGADFVVENHGDEADLLAQVDELHKKLIKIQAK